MIVGIILAGLCLGIVALAVLFRPKQGLHRTSLSEHKTTIFKDAGFQMEIPTETPFVSSSAASVLVMVHEIRRGFRAEARYLIKVHVKRMLKADMDDGVEFASQPFGDEIQKWRYRIHPGLDVKQTPDVWYLRKDIEAPSGEFLSVDAELTVTEFAETDRSEIKRMIESIRLNRK